MKIIILIKNEKRISALKNKVLLKLKKPLDDNSSIPKFICQKISEDNSKDKKILMNLIDKYIHKKKKENKYQNDFDQKNKEIIALKEYKKHLNQNIDNKLYNGKIINASEQGDIKEKYDTIRKLIYNNSFINKKKEEIIKKEKTKNKQLRFSSPILTNYYEDEMINNENIPLSENDRKKKRLLSSYVKSMQRKKIESFNSQIALSKNELKQVNELYKIQTVKKKRNSLTNFVNQKKNIINDNYNIKGQIMLKINITKKQKKVKRKIRKK